MFTKDLNLAVLFDLYGDLLTESQKNMFDYYYNDDLSLSEIAENTGISRQGARDSIKRAEETLVHFEETLHLAKKAESREQTKEILEMLLADILKKCPDASEETEKIRMLFDNPS